MLWLPRCTLVPELCEDREKPGILMNDTAHVELLWRERGWVEMVVVREQEGYGNSRPSGRSILRSWARSSACLAVPASRATTA